MNLQILTFRKLGSIVRKDMFQYFIFSGLISKGSVMRTSYCKIWKKYKKLPKKDTTLTSILIEFVFSF